MKKIISLILAATMVFCTMLPSFAAEANISAAKTSVKKGETVDVAVSLSDKIENCLNFEYNVYFDPEYFELQSSAIGNASSLTNLSVKKSDTKGSYYSVSFVDITSNGVEIKSGTVYTLTFKAIKDVEADEVSSFEIVRKNVAVLSDGKIVKNKDGDIGSSKADITVKVKGENEFSGIKATISAPANVNSAVGTEFNAIIYSTEWDDKAYKLLDAIVNIPEGLAVTGVTPGAGLYGGTVNYNLDSENKLRITYNDANEMKTLKLIGNDFPAVLFTIGLKVNKLITAGGGTISLGGMSLKLNSDSEDQSSQNVFIIPTEKDEQGNTGSAVISFVSGTAIKAANLFVGDGIDLIPADKKAVLISITGLGSENVKLTYKKGETTHELFYSEEISELTGNLCYVAIAGSGESLEDYVDIANYEENPNEESETITFGDTNGDDLINAQDALNIINAWIRKTPVETEKTLLTYNVNSDSRINTYDALAIEEAFINSASFKIITRATALTSNAG